MKHFTPAYQTADDSGLKLKMETYDRSKNMDYLNFASQISNNEHPERLISLVDVSPSMDEEDWKPSRKAGAIRANIELVKAKAKDHPHDVVGIAGFGSEAKVLHNPVRLKGSVDSICRSLKEPPMIYGTNFVAAFEMADYLLFGKHPPKKERNSLLKSLLEPFCEFPACEPVREPVEDGVTRRIIILTDGDHNCQGDPIRFAGNLKRAGVVIDCIGIGGTPKDVNEEMLKAIASRNPDGSIRYCFIGDQQTLIKTYNDLAGHIRPI